MTAAETLRISRLFSDTFSGSPRLARNALAALALFAACVLLSVIDDRIFNGVSTWHKPAKFYLSVAVLFATVAWAQSLVPAEIRARRSIRWSEIALLGSSWFELAYITFRAARAEGSHYNIDTPLESALYNLMGLGALTMTMSSAVVGFVLWRHRGKDIWREAAGLGLVLGAVLATLTAFVLASMTSHWIGGDQTDATGLPLFYWSTTGGDLRVAHFIGLHAMQALPFAALSGRRSIVYGTALAVIALTAATFAQGLMGIPLLRP